MTILDIPRNDVAAAVAYARACVARGEEVEYEVLYMLQDDYHELADALQAEERAEKK